MTMGFDEKLGEIHERMTHRKVYPFEEERAPAGFESERRFNVKLNYYTNCVDITHPVDFFQTARDENDAKVIALQKYPTGSDVTVTECFD